MENIITSSPDFLNYLSTPKQKQINLKQKENYNPEVNEKYIDEKEENDNLGYLTGINYTNLNYFKEKQQLDSKDPPKPKKFKFSIDMPNVSRERLLKFLNEDLLDALEICPKMPNINDEIQNNINDNINTNDNPSNLFGFSLYPPNPQFIDNNLEKSKINYMNYIQEYNFYPNKDLHQGDNQNNIINNNFQKVYNNYIYFNNYNVNNNDNKLTNNNDNLKITLNNNPLSFNPKERNKDYNQKNNNYYYNYDKINPKNKFNNIKKNIQKAKRFGKAKKNFEARFGDWTCSKCNNLNFSFRNICNRCGIPKELSKKIHEDLLYLKRMK